MAKYRKIDPKIWNDAKFCALTESEKLAFIYLLTHPHLTMIGAMRHTVFGIGAELKKTTTGFAKIFATLCSNGMVKYDVSASFIWLPNFLKYNRPESPNVVLAWGGALDLLPECDMKQELIRHMEAFTKGLPKAFQEAFRRVLSKGMPYQEQEQEQEQEQLIPDGRTARHPAKGGATRNGGVREEKRVVNGRATLVHRGVRTRSRGSRS